MSDAKSRKPLVAAATLIVLLVAVAVVVVVAGLGRDRGRAIEQLELVDLTTPAMVLEMARGLGKPYVIELPSVHPIERHDLRLADSSELEALEEIQLLDPRFRFELRPAVIVYWFGGGGSGNPYDTLLPVFSRQGGAGSVVRDLVVEAGVADRLAVQSDAAGRNRPVSLELTDVTLREALAEVAAQAHLGMRNDPMMVRFHAAPE